MVKFASLVIALVFSLSVGGISFVGAAEATQEAIQLVSSKGDGHHGEGHKKGHGDEYHDEDHDKKHKKGHGKDHGKGHDKGHKKH